MDTTVALLLVGAAVLHAGWNTLVRGRSDPAQAMLVMSFASSALAVAVVVTFPAPRPACVPFVALSAALQLGYARTLARAYRTGELGQVYPIARGTAPVLVALAAAIFAGEAPRPAAMAGIALVFAGAAALAGATASLATPLATGAFIAGYTVTDGLGARASGNPVAYTAYVFLLYGVALPFTARRARGVERPGPRDVLLSLAAGLLSALGYGVVVVAASRGPMGPVSALRETSVLFAALFARVFLGEALPLRRVLGCAAIAAGAAMVSGL